jgi:hypothetical protein
MSIQQIPCLLWKLKVHFHVHESPPLAAESTKSKALGNNSQYYLLRWETVSHQPTLKLEDHALSARRKIKND